jgi:hypothetical protein
MPARAVEVVHHLQALIGPAGSLGLAEGSEDDVRPRWPCSRRLLSAAGADAIATQPSQQNGALADTSECLLKDCVLLGLSGGGRGRLRSMPVSDFTWL